MKIYFHEKLYQRLSFLAEKHFPQVRVQQQAQPIQFIHILSGKHIKDEFRK